MFDKIKVKYKAMTQADEDLGVPDASGFISYCARVSSLDNRENWETGPRLVDYLVKHSHWSPLEMVNMVFEIDVPRDIGRQILRHRSFSFQEFSQRYADVSELGDFMVRECRMQDPKNRQNSLVCEDEELARQWEVKQEQIIHEVKLAYQWAADNGIAKEVRRVILPEGNTMSKIIVNGTLRSWIHYISLRHSHGTQKEHMDVANKLKPEIIKRLPMLEKYLVAD